MGRAPWKRNMVKRSSYIPNRGDIVWADFDPQKGHEQAHRRPALVVSPRSYNEKTGLIIACPITSKRKGYMFEVSLDSGKMKGVILADQIRSLDCHARRIIFIQKLGIDIVAEVRKSIMELLTEE